MIRQTCPRTTGKLIKCKFTVSLFELQTCLFLINGLKFPPVLLDFALSGTGDLLGFCCFLLLFLFIQDSAFLPIWAFTYCSVAICEFGYLTSCILSLVSYSNFVKPVGKSLAPFYRCQLMKCRFVYISGFCFPLG